MGNRERVILTSKAERIAERAVEMAWAPRPGLPSPIPCPALGGVPAKAPVRRTRSSPCCRRITGVTFGGGSQRGICAGSRKFLQTSRL
jgi:hypothetical protein